MERFHSFSNRDYQKLSYITNSIAYEIGGRLGRNSTFDERGLTDEFLDLLQKYFDNIKLSKNYINLQLNKPSEKKTGADILFRIKVNLKEISFDRYVLIQAKKYLINSGHFSETDIGNKHLSSQVAKMHNYNSEFSYILLYSTDEEPLGNKVIKNNLQYPEMHLRFHPKDPFYDDFITIGPGQLSPKIHSGYPITFLRSKTWEKLKNNESENLLNYSETFPNFLLDDLVTGKIGKEWDDSIQKAEGEFSIVVTLTYGLG